MSHSTQLFFLLMLSQVNYRQVKCPIPSMELMTYCEHHLIFQYLIAANKTPEEIAEMEEPDDDELNLAMRVARGSAFALW